MFEPAHVCGEEITQIGNAVFQHGEPVDPHTEGEALIDIEEDEVEEGQVVSCPECSVDLEVVNTHPLELDLAEEEEDLEEEEMGPEDNEEEDL